MINKIKLKSEFTVPQKFFADKIMEIFDNRSIDSYRARMHNPYTILEELVLVFKDLKDKKIKDFEKTVIPLINEVKALVTIDCLLNFDKINYDYLSQILNSAKSDNFIELLYSLQVLIDNNKDYISRLFESLETELQKSETNNSPLNELEKIEKTINFIATGLVSKGFSKDYLYRLSKKIFGLEYKENFTTSFACFKELATRGKEKFTIVFRCSGNQKIWDGTLNEMKLEDEKINEYKILNTITTNYFKDRFVRFGYVECEAYDYLAVISKARQKISQYLDLIHMGYNAPDISIKPKLLVIGENNPSNADSWSMNSFLDGTYKSNKDHFSRMQIKLKQIEEKKNISGEAKHKLTSGIRYLRLGIEAAELEQKFLNFWIGLEYLFSSYAEIHASTITRLKEKLIAAHKLIYLKRNLMDFHNDLNSIKDDGILTWFSNSETEYLLDQVKYDLIISSYRESRPYIAYKATRLKSLTHAKDKYQNALKKHTKNLEWHLTRAYRLRNEIVHDAAINLDLKVIVGNLRYYLVFAINGLIEFFLNPNISATINEHYNIDDFFTMRTIMFKNIQELKNPLVGFMSVDNPTEIFA